MCEHDRYSHRLHLTHVGACGTGGRCGARARDASTVRESISLEFAGHHSDFAQAPRCTASMWKALAVMHRALLSKPRRKTKLKDLSRLRNAMAEVAAERSAGGGHRPPDPSVGAAPARRRRKRSSGSSMRSPHLRASAPRPSPRSTGCRSSNGRILMGAAFGTAGRAITRAVGLRMDWHRTLAGAPGGYAPRRAPIRRRPPLLRSLLTKHNHATLEPLDECHRSKQRGLSFCLRNRQRDFLVRRSVTVNVLLPQKLHEATDGDERVARVQLREHGRELPAGACLRAAIALPSDPAGSAGMMTRQAAVSAARTAWWYPSLGFGFLPYTCCQASPRIFAARDPLLITSFAASTAERSTRRERPRPLGATIHADPPRFRMSSRS